MNSLRRLKQYLLLGIFLLANAHADSPLDTFQQKFPGLIYQDIVIGDEIYPIGTDLCEQRYNLIRPVLDLFDRPFTVFDLGAAQGYFSLRTAKDYPHSSCVMVEADETSYYSRHGSMLYQLCQMNKDLVNLCYLQRRMDIHDLYLLKKQEHFDVVLAFLVVHLMHEKLHEQIKIIQCLLELGDFVIIEVANDVAVLHTTYVEHLSETLDCQFLGEVKRHKNPHSTSTGKLYLFRQPCRGCQPSEEKSTPITKETFFNLNGVYPKDVYKSL